LFAKPTLPKSQPCALISTSSTYGPKLEVCAPRTLEPSPVVWIRLIVTLAVKMLV
jgi:hypothetical protein